VFVAGAGLASGALMWALYRPPIRPTADTAVTSDSLAPLH
jgi:hypothetical protein